MLLKPYTANIIIDGQFGSTGKGSFAAFIALNDEFDIGVCNTAPNAGHTAITHDKKIITKHLPISSIISNKPIYLNAAARINPDILMDECLRYHINPKDVVIHPRAAIISQDDIEMEKDLTSNATKLASTQSGVGAATINKIKRLPQAVAKNNGFILEKFSVQKIDLNAEIKNNKTILLETGQGYGLGINEGFSYPYCTSHNITVSQTLADANIHPKNLGNVILTLRTYPIRVGNIVDKTGNEIGFSGPFYEDSKEISYADLGLEQEYTTNTKRPRRMATFSFKQYTEVTSACEPNIIFLNFANYCSENELNALIDKMMAIYKPEKLYLGYGSSIEDIVLYKF